jgi:hypothetical protein
MFTRIRMEDGWYLSSVISPLEFEALDAIRPSCIDGDGGGTYAVSALLSIGGLAVTLNPATLTLSAAAMAVSAPGTWSAAQTFGSGAPIASAGANTWTGANTFAGAAVHSGLVTHSGDDGRRVNRTGSIPSVNSTVDVTKDIWQCGVPLVGLTHTLRHSTSPIPNEGEEMKIWRNATGAFDIVLQREDATIVATLPSGVKSSVVVTYYTSGGWRVTMGDAYT